MESFVLDTNLFFNMEPGLGIGKKTEEVVSMATQLMKKARDAKKAQFFMPPRIVDEFLSFFEDKNQKFIKEFLSVVTVKSPDISSSTFSAAVFYDLVKDIRERSYRGLTIAEEELRRAVASLGGSPSENKQEAEKALSPHIKTLRDRFRQATRFGFLDSVADLDLIVLTKETGGYLVSTDEGVIRWGRTFGVAEMEASVFGKKLLSYGSGV